MRHDASGFDTVEDAIREIRAGRVVIVADDEDRENEGDLVCAAAKITPGIINFMATHGRGLICTALSQTRADQLGLPLMTDQNDEAFRTAFTVSVDDFVVSAVLEPSDDVGGESPHHGAFRWSWRSCLRSNPALRR